MCWRCEQHCLWGVLQEWGEGGVAGWQYSSKLLSAGRQRSTRPVKQAKRNHFAQNYLFDFSLFAFVVNQLRLNE